ncbi:hypothetical protein [Yinghuangia seranimata]|uniref:hypothetical protein n=1 Tax=Yinghuangia seranimata TaxID=408067 RepID=UPI00248AB762|nr:hypothetical protein [Yinghuangia seranimata]MDI2131256.1 hypothetical protein [Yinghuangia seranimata]
MTHPRLRAAAAFAAALLAAAATGCGASSGSGAGDGPPPVSVAPDSRIDVRTISLETAQVPPVQAVFTVARSAREDAAVLAQVYAGDLTRTPKPPSPAVDFARNVTITVATGTGCRTAKSATLRADGTTLGLDLSFDGPNPPECVVQARVLVRFEVPSERLPKSPVMFDGVRPASPGLGVLRVYEKATVAAGRHITPAQIPDQAAFSRWMTGLTGTPAPTGQWPALDRAFKAKEPGEELYAFAVRACGRSVPRLEPTSEGFAVMSAESPGAAPAASCPEGEYRVAVFGLLPGEVPGGSGTFPDPGGAG